MKTATVGNFVIGKGAPKIVVSLMGRDIVTVKSEALVYRGADSDVLEWRVDHFTDVFSIGVVLEVVHTIRDAVADKPLLSISRSAKEGGEQALSAEHYTALNRVAVDSGLVDMIGLGLFIGDELVKATIEHTHAKDVFVIMSNHDLHKTPAVEKVIQRSCKAQEPGADIPKIALMPQNKADALTLLSATLEMQERYANRPTITMSMAKTGVVLCLSSEIFGPVATFGVVKEASAPGQIPVTGLHIVLIILHQV